MAKLPEVLSSLDRERLPRHVAIIMDGNGRWAKRRGLPRSAGHYEGVTSVRRVTQFTSDLGISYLTLYAFSTENWNRPPEEVATLMHLIGVAIKQELPDLISNNVKLDLIGDISRIPEEARNELLYSRDATSHCTGLTLSMCLSYSSRWEIVRAARELAEKAVRGELLPASITENEFSSHLATYPIPDPDLLIRTGGDQRISNYLLWQLAYSELFFTDVLWPDFSAADYAEALRAYCSRERRFGLTSEQVASQEK